ncbi:SLC13 family permease [soil metagenome]
MPLLLFALGMILVLGGILWLRLHPFLALIIAAVAVALLTPDAALTGYAEAQVAAGKLSDREATALVNASSPSRVVSEFGVTCGKVGIIIAMAAIIGQCLLASGAAARIVEALLAVFGQARAALAFITSGFLLAIPVFFDTVFYLLMPLGRALHQKSGKDYLLYVLAIVAGGTMAHSLVPPTPGPLFVAGELGVSLGAMIMGGLAVGSVSVAFGYWFALRANARHTVVPDAEAPGSAPPDLARLIRPPLWLALLPVLLPIGLIALGTVLVPYASKLASPPAWLPPLEFLADKNVALTLSALIALLMLARATGAGTRAGVGTALASGATIILITAAGGAFGGVLRQTGIALSIQDVAGSAQVAVLPMVFLVTMLVRTAQGSATVAMITAAPVAKAFLDAGDLAFHPVYLALAIGCGSKPIPWMNDSGFWVITRMAGLKESETLRFVTPMMSLMGLVGLGATMLFAFLLPMR